MPKRSGDKKLKRNIGVQYVHTAVLLCCCTACRTLTYILGGTTAVGRYYAPPHLAYIQYCIFNSVYSFKFIMQHVTSDPLINTVKSEGLRVETTAVMSNNSSSAVRSALVSV